MEIAKFLVRNIIRDRCFALDVELGFSTKTAGLVGVSSRETVGAMKSGRRVMSLLTSARGETWSIVIATDVGHEGGIGTIVIIHPRTLLEVAALSLRLVLVGAILTGNGIVLLELLLFLAVGITDLDEILFSSGDANRSVVEFFDDLLAGFAGIEACEPDATTDT